jgi:hypothetical protein
LTEVSPLTTVCRNTVVVALGLEPAKVTVVTCVYPEGAVTFVVDGWMLATTTCSPALVPEDSVRVRLVALPLALAVPTSVIVGWGMTCSRGTSPGPYT